MQHQRVESILIQLESEMRRLNLWSDSVPSEDALASQEPFCIDTLNFLEWLQFVFIDRMRVLVESEASLPSACGILPMAEEYFRGQDVRAKGIVSLLGLLDDVLSNQ